MFEIDAYIDVMRKSVEKVGDILIDLEIAVQNHDLEKIIRYAQKLADVANDVADDAVTAFDIDDIWE